MEPLLNTRKFLAGQLSKKARKDYIYYVLKLVIIILFSAAAFFNIPEPFPKLLEGSYESSSVLLLIGLAALIYKLIEKRAKDSKQRFIIFTGTFIFVYIALYYFLSQMELFNKSPEYKEAAITLSRTACFGKCPVYNLKIHTDGLVIYEGQQDVKVVGTRTGQISPEKVKELIEEFYKINYFKLKESNTDSNLCETDHPAIITSITIDGKAKKVHDNLGCPFPSKLRDLEIKIDEVAGSKRWVRIR